MAVATFAAANVEVRMTDHPNLNQQLILAQMHRIQMLEMVLEDLQKLVKFMDVGTVVLSRVDWDLCMKRAERKHA